MAKRKKAARKGVKRATRLRERGLVALRELPREELIKMIREEMLEKPFPSS